jgi:GNAT superfamily N-acetyltransferase
MFTPADWDRLVADHAVPNVLLVATDKQGNVVGYAAAHPGDGELFLLFVHPAHGGRGIGRALLEASRTVTAPRSASSAWPSNCEAATALRVVIEGLGATRGTRKGVAECG